MTKMTTFNVAAALAGALAVTTAATTPVSAQGLIKCYGISLKAQNSCGNAAKTHSCAGLATIDFDGGEWRAVNAAAVCENLNGTLEPTEGINVQAKVKYEELAARG